MKLCQIKYLVVEELGRVKNKIGILVPMPCMANLHIFNNYIGT